VSGFTEEFLAVIDNFIEAARNDTEAICVVAVRIAEKRGDVCADDIVEVMDINRDRRIVGGALGHLKKRGVIYEHGFTRTKRKSSHGRPIFIYKLADEWKKHWRPDYIDPTGDPPVKNLNGDKTFV